MVDFNSMRVDTYANEFKELVKKHKITVFPVRECSMCGTQLRYLFAGDNIFFDTNCACVNYTTDIKQRTWEELGKLYINNKDTPLGEEMRKLFKVNE